MFATSVRPLINGSPRAIYVIKINKKSLYIFNLQYYLSLGNVLLRFETAEFLLYVHQLILKQNRKNLDYYPHSGGQKIKCKTLLERFYMFHCKAEA